jgi:hypothetical protein
MCGKGVGQRDWRENLHLNEVVNHVEPTKPAFILDLGSKHRLGDGLSRRVVRGEARHDAEVPRVRLEEL